MITALFFGSFNPIHFGHISISKYLIQNENLDEVRFILSPHNPVKNIEDLEDPKTRMSKLIKSISSDKDLDLNKVKVSDIEFSLPTPLYTINTLKHIRNSEPEDEHILIIGGDNIQIIEKWYKWEEILKNFEVWVYPRKGSNAKECCEKYNSFAWVKKVRYLNSAPFFDISSTEIRQKTK